MEFQQEENRQYELESAIRELFSNSIRLDAADISVSVFADCVTLSGTVKSQRERDLATELVKLIDGVREINNEIIVKLNRGILPTDLGRHA